MVILPRSAFGMNYCEIRCKYDDDFNTAHVMTDQNWNDSLNYQMIQSVNVLKDMIIIIIKYLYSYTHKNIKYLNAVYIDLH